MYSVTSTSVAVILALNVFDGGAQWETNASSEVSAGQAKCTNNSRWESLILDHVARYEKMQIADLYKLLHQATMGSEHAVPSIVMARRWLSDELADLPTGADEPLVDILGEGGRVARVHLRPFVAQVSEPERLLEAFAATASGSYGDLAELECAILSASDLSRLGQLPWPARDIAAFISARAADGYPAVHHSPEYEATYGPAYRVIALELVPDALAP